MPPTKFESARVYIFAMATGLPNVLRDIIASYISDLELDSWIERSKLTFVPLSECVDGLAELSLLWNCHHNNYLINHGEDRAKHIWRTIVICGLDDVDWDAASTDPAVIEVLSWFPEYVDWHSLQFNPGIYSVTDKAAIVAML